MRVIVDADMCEANGFCESIAPDIFVLGDEDVVQIADGPVPPDRRSTSAPRWTSAPERPCGSSSSDLPSRSTPKSIALQRAMLGMPAALTLNA